MLINGINKYLYFRVIFSDLDSDSVVASVIVLFFIVSYVMNGCFECIELRCFRFEAKNDVLEVLISDIGSKEGLLGLFRKTEVTNFTRRLFMYF